MNRIALDELELQLRVEKNYQRLCEPYYQIQEVFADPAYSWPGDKEGRALLAFVKHYCMNGKKVPCMEMMIEQIPEKTNRFFFFGNEAGEVIHEQQLSGHNWYLRGLLEYYLAFEDERALQYAKSTVENLYYPIRGRFASYPIEREQSHGGVGGHSTVVQNNWLLSTDVGCAYMSVDGLAQYYEITRDENVLALLREMREYFDAIDKMKIKAQTHCCLTAARGFLRLYHTTGDKVFFTSAKTVVDLYLTDGMTYTYQNYNWWNRGDTWTEPCAIVDSLMCTLELYKCTREENYRTMAARIWHNGFAAMQVGNGGAGTTTTVSKTQPVLYTDLYEAHFCCTMRLAEGLWYAMQNQDLLYAESKEVQKDIYGRYMMGDILLAEVTVDEQYLELLPEAIQSMDGHQLQPLVKYYLYPKNITDSIKQKVIFT